MSLINDALKRAKQTHQRHTPPVASSVPLRPVDSAARRAPASGAIWLLFGALLLGLAAVALIFVAVRGGVSKPASLASTPAKPVVTETAAPVASPSPAPPSSAKVAAIIPEVAKSQPPPAAVPVETTPAAQVTAPPAVDTAPPAPTPATNAPVQPAVATITLPKLQGILYRPEQPSALLNGRSVFVGGRSGEFLVVAITRQWVTLVRDGVTNELRLVE